MAIVLLVSGCASPMMGPRSIGFSRPGYNEAIKQTNDQELLLNLVRNRYRDTMYFTNVERVASSVEFLQSISASQLETRTANGLLNAGSAAASTFSNVLTRTLTAGPASMAMNEKPTVFYAPVEGEKFVRQMMTPMNPDLLLMLVKSGWSFDRVFSLAVQEIDGLKNAPTASGPAPSVEPEYKDFREAVKLLRVLQREQHVDFAKSSSGTGIDLIFTPGAADKEEMTKFKEMLGLNPALNRYRIIFGANSHDPDTIAMVTRPIISAMSYIGTGIEVPEADIKAGKVRRTLKKDGSPFDWQDMLGGVFRVMSSDKEPENASVVVPYRGSYFYIADNDLDTKSTFLLLSQLISLNAAPATAGPGMSFSFGN